MKQLVQLGLMLVIAIPSATMAQTPATQVVNVVDTYKATLIHLSPKPTTVNIGRVAKQAPIASIPFSYNQAVRLTQDYKLGLGVKTMPAGTMGFTVPLAEGQADKRQYYCLFGKPDDSGNPYAEPFCYVSNYQMLFGKLKVATVPVSNNLMVGHSGLSTTASQPEIEATDAPIDHDFHLDVSFKRWFRNAQGQLGIMIVLTSEGRVIEETFQATDSDNVLRLQADDGLVTLTIDPADQDHVTVSFIKSPA